MKPRKGFLVVNGRYVKASVDTPEYYLRAYGPSLWKPTTQPPARQATSQPKEAHTMAAKSTQAKVAEATEAAEAATASTKGKAKTPAAPATPAKVKSTEPKAPTAPVSDAELAKLQKAKDAETDPKERAVLRRKLRAALRSRGEFVPVSERPKKEKPAKASKPAVTTGKAKKSK